MVAATPAPNGNFPNQMVGEYIDATRFDFWNTIAFPYPATLPTYRVV